MDLLIGHDKSAQRFGIKVAVSVGDERPGHAEDAGVAGERPLGELGQLSIIVGRQIGVNLADLLFDKMVIVQQPLCCGHHRPLAFNLDGAGTIGGQQNGGVAFQPLAQR
ncbi:hypothetical protein [Devosia sp. UYZn731]|uniref:hypothetical protein n=1 Tax=Devosia sp. UYZn731 TaxID=3156345 RepID=UPI0033993266